MDKLETGDILLFNGKYFLSRIIEYFTNCNYSHVGIVLKDPTYIDPKLIGLYLLQSGEENFRDSEDNKFKIGVQISDLNKCLESYKGNVYYRKLNCNKDDRFYNNLIKIHDITYDKPYDLNPIDWIKADLDIDIGKDQKTNTFWCSALAAYVYVKLGFLSKDIPWTLIKPFDFSCKSNKLKFKNCCLDDEKLLEL